MLKDPMLRWTKSLIIDWISIDLEGFKEYLYKIPLTSKQRIIILHKYVPNDSNNHIFHIALKVLPLLVHL